MSKPAPTFYILHGDDLFTLEQALAEFRAKMNETDNGDLNTSEFDGTTASVSEIINAVSSYPFLADKRMVIVKGMLAVITRRGAGEAAKKAVEQLAEALPNLPDWARLIFVEREPLSEKNKLVKLAQDTDTGYEKSFTAPKDTTGWILKRAHEAYGAEIEPRAAVALAAVTGSDLGRADAELVKLISYVDGERAITEADVDLLTPYLAEARVFDMVDAMTEGRTQAALQQLHRLLQEKDEDPFRVYGMIVRQFRLLLLAKEFLAAGGYPKDMASALGMAPFVAKKMTQQSRGFSLGQLDRIYHALFETDLKMKTGQIDPELALDLLIAGLGIG
ncbi:MAG: DNA polymerase III subunit delta [Anaerolineaceae bacterium]|nr:DNA polymerase III subunit delta [Anaerolineaceae bacterium]